MQAILIFPLPLHWMTAMRKNTGREVANMKRIRLRDDCSNFRDLFVVKHADNVCELCSGMTTLNDAKELQGGDVRLSPECGDGTPYLHQKLWPHFFNPRSTLKL